MTDNRPPLSFHPTPLYGGAITASLPASFANASQFRQVPDNQEVFVEPRNDAPISIIFDLLERAPRASGLEAVVYHLDDVRDESDRARVLDRKVEKLGKMTSVSSLGS
jgi:hypothetical protein